MLKATLATVGLILSMYALYVEYRLDHPDEGSFTALCDIASLGASCSTVFGLPVGHMLSYFGLVPAGSVLDLPNAALGVVYYVQQLVVPLPAALNLLMATLALATSVFLAYQLTFVLGDLCLLCWTTHLINAALFCMTVMSSDVVPAKQKSA